jgi:low molecular weight protein-tyrosine phosphatase
MPTTKIMFVCLGNICRSAMAEGSLRHLAEQQGVEHLVEIASAGTGDWHVGEPPDARATATALHRGIDISMQQAQKVKPEDFEYYDYLLAMDQENHMNLSRMAPAHHKHKVQLFLKYAPDQPEREVPDPYYGGDQGFEHVLNLVQAASRGLLDEITS